MAFSFTPAQQKVLDARGHNVLVSAAAGSGKTAVLVERIVRLVSDGENPVDIDRLLVVTFTRAAAAQMRERIGQALAQRLSREPKNQHLQNQQVLLHNAQITTMDSFFTFLLRNYFCDIDLDPGFRQIEQTESSLIAKEVMDTFLEEKYAAEDAGFLRCVEYFCTGTGDREIEELIMNLCNRAGSHPSWQAWLRERAYDYDVPDEEALFRTPWMQSAVHRLSSLLMEMDAQYAAMENICLETDGMEAVLVFLREERESLFGGIRTLMADGLSGGEKESEGCRAAEDNFKDECQKQKCLWEEIRRSLSYQFPRYPSPRGKKAAEIDPGAKNAVKAMRDAQKKQITGLSNSVGGSSPEAILEMMRSAREPMQTLSSLALEFYGRFQQAKQERHVIDFVDLEHFALNILAERREDGTYVPRRAAKALRSYYAEILIDEYQDSNEVQELMLRIISGEEDGINNRFMVGDIKQSIYRFRLARPEIFMEKYDSYRTDDKEKEKIELDQNFRSRREVLDCVNSLFMRIMRREIGGVEYNGNVSLKQGADYPAAGSDESLSYRAELLLLDTGSSSAGDGDDPADNDALSGVRADSGSPDGYGSGDVFRENPEDLPEEKVQIGDDPASLTEKQKEALLIAGRISQIVGHLPVRDEESGQMRPARYKDVVVLLRSTVGWNEDLRAVFDREGIPSYAESRTGYFAAREIREVIGLLRILDNPRQDIPLYGTLGSYFGGFSQDEIASIRLTDPDGQLYDALVKTAQLPSAKSMESAHSASGDIGNKEFKRPEPNKNDHSPGPDGELASRCREFLDFLETWRRRAQYLSVSEVVEGLLEQTGFLDYCTALPAGGQRAANLAFLRSQADAFTKTDFTGLFQFLRFIDGIRRQEIDYGEANILDENADVVRIMSIHKSKGLEFPVCFVAGLSSDFSFRRFDASGTMLFDSDWGTGIYYYDPVSRIRASTLRREELAEKIRRDCLGEELRVLYVALTRAKEKLIMTASAKDWGKKLDSWKSKMAGFFMMPGNGKLYPSMIGGASSFAELICEAVMAKAGPDPDRVFFGEDQGESFPIQVRIMSDDDLILHAGREQLELSCIDEIWRGMEGRPLDRQPDPEAAGKIADRYFYTYPHEELRDLYAHTSVSEIKHRAMQSASGTAGGDASGTMVYEGLQGAGTGSVLSGEGAAEMFPEITPVPYLPSFVRDGSGDDVGGSSAEGSGARRGTVFHRILELIDYGRRDEFLQDYPEEKGDDPERKGTALDIWMGSLSERGLVSGEDAALVKTWDVVHFLRSDLAARMARAAEQGKLYRERSFLMGCPADEVEWYASGGKQDPDRPGFPHDEVITLQGVIDAFFVENGRIILVDYKTDRVRMPRELIMRYQTQLEIYARALQQAYSMPVAEKIIYSSHLGKEIRI